MRLAVFQPDIAANLGAMVRLCACLDVPMDVIEPCGFAFSVKALRRAAMDYGELADVTRWDDWNAFEAARSGRLVLLTTSGAVSHDLSVYRPDDVLLVGRESAGAPPEVHQAADLRVRIDMAPGARSLNVGMAAAIVLAEARRQLKV
ncbi:MAG: TrmH family RNA methyltransferase [Pseudomonadota bacterium]